MANSAVSASLLGGGRTAHSELKIQIHCTEDSICSIAIYSKFTDTIRQAHLIRWDEIMMCVRYCVEPVTKRFVLSCRHRLHGFEASLSYSVGISVEYSLLFHELPEE